MAYVESRLRALERRFVRARAELAVHQFVEAVMLHWDEYVRYCAQNESDTASLELYHKLWPGTVQVPTWLSAIVYLDECRHKGEVPEPRHLTTRLAPWTARIRPVTWPAAKPRALPRPRSY